MMGTRMKRSAGAGIFVLIGAAVIIWAASPQPEENLSDFLKGKVHYLDKNDLSLAKKIKLAETEFKKSKAGDAYFTGYVFLTSHEIHMGEIEIRMGKTWKSSIPFRVTGDETGIKVHRKYRSNITSQSLDSEKGREPVGLLLLHRISKGKGEIQDARMIDLDQTFEFEELPVYWLGEAGNEESFRFLVRKRSQEKRYLLAGEYQGCKKPRLSQRDLQKRKRYRTKKADCLCHPAQQRERGHD